MKWFKPSEVKGLTQALANKLDWARDIAGIPFFITSGKRTVTQNKASGGAKNSRHLTGEAVDLRCQASWQCLKILYSLMAVGINKVVIGVKLDTNDPGGVRFHNIHCEYGKSVGEGVSVKLYG